MSDSSPVYFSLSSAERSCFEIAGGADQGPRPPATEGEDSYSQRESVMASTAKAMTIIERTPSGGDGWSEDGRGDRRQDPLCLIRFRFRTAVLMAHPILVEELFHLLRDHVPVVRHGN